MTLKWRQTTCSTSLHITAWLLTEAKLLRQSILTFDNSAVGYNVQWNINQNTNMLKDENEIGNVICKMATISFRPQHINEWDADYISSRFFVTCIFITWHPRRLSITSCLHAFRGNADSFNRVGNITTLNGIDISYLNDQITHFLGNLIRGSWKGNIFTNINSSNYAVNITNCQLLWFRMRLHCDKPL